MTTRDEPIEWTDRDQTWLTLLLSNDRSGSLLLGQATAEHIIAALQANPELRQRVLAALCTDESVFCSAHPAGQECRMCFTSLVRRVEASEAALRERAKELTHLAELIDNGRPRMHLHHATEALVQLWSRRPPQKDQPQAQPEDSGATEPPAVEPGGPERPRPSCAASNCGLPCSDITAYRVIRDGDPFDYCTVECAICHATQIGEERAEESLQELEAQLAEAQALLVAHAGDNEALRAELSQFKRMADALEDFADGSEVPCVVRGAHPGVYECRTESVCVGCRARHRVEKLQADNAELRAERDVLERDLSELVAALRYESRNDREPQGYANQLLDRVADRLERGGKADG